MILKEPLFEDVAYEDEEDIDESCKSKNKKLKEEYHGPSEYADKLLEYVEEGILDGYSTVLMLVKYMGNDDVKDCMLYNEIDPFENEDEEDIDESIVKIAEVLSDEYYYKQKRDSLADIIQQELSEGEQVYKMTGSGKYSVTNAHGLQKDVGIEYGDNDVIYITTTGATEAELKPVEDIAKKYNRPIQIVPNVGGKPDAKFIAKIEVKESDFDGHYFDPNVKVLSSKKSKTEESIQIKGKVDEDLVILGEFSDYEPWSGAVSTFERIEEEDKLDELENYLEAIWPDGCRTVDINDLLWFESDEVFDALGISDEDEDEEDEE